jgi:hypothetical protein
MSEKQVQSMPVEILPVDVRTRFFVIKKYRLRVAGA